MLAYFEREVFGYSKEITTQLATIGGLRNMILMVLMVPLNLVYSTLGPRPLMIMSVILTTSGMMLMGMATKLWHLYLFYSVFTGCAASMFQLTAFRVIPQWFEEKQRSTAFGIYFSSLGLGGVIVPLITTAVESKLGGPWIFRILGISAFIFGSIACIAITENRRNIAQSDEDGKANKATDFSGVIKARNMGIFLLVNLIQTSVQMIPNMFLPSYANYIGAESWKANTTTMILLGMTIPGAVIAGITADRIGNLNTLMIFTAMAALSTSTIWTFAYTFQMLEVYCAIYGLFGTVILTLGAPVTISLIGVEKYPSAITLSLLTNLLCAFGPTAASGIEGISSIEPYLSYKIFVSVGFLISLILQLIIRVRKEKSLFVKV